MDIYKMCVESADYIRSVVDCTDAIGIVLGSGLGNMADDIKDGVVISYKDIPNFPMTKVAGHAGEIVVGKLNGVKVMCFKGRFHFYEGYDMKIVSMPVRVMKLLGVRALILTNAAGGVNLDYDPGTLMLIDDFINYMGDNPLVGDNVEEFGPRFPDMVKALDDNFKTIAQQVASELGINLRKGVYMSFRGPNFETPAEIRFARTCGADAVGMSTVPEILVARHCQLPTVGISCITNFGAGITGKELTHEEVKETADRVNGQFKALLQTMITRM